MPARVRRKNESQYDKDEKQNQEHRTKTELHHAKNFAKSTEERELQRENDFNTLGWIKSRIFC